MVYSNLWLGSASLYITTSPAWFATSAGEVHFRNVPPFVLRACTPVAWQNISGFLLQTCNLTYYPLPLILPSRPQPSSNRWAVACVRSEEHTSELQSPYDLV